MALKRKGYGLCGLVEELRPAEIGRSSVTLGSPRWGQKVRRSPLSVKEPRTGNGDATML